MNELSDKVDAVIENYKRLFNQVYETVGGQKAQGIDRVLEKREKAVRWQTPPRGYNSHPIPLHTRIVTGIGSQPLMFSGRQYTQKLRGYDSQIYEPPLEPLKAIKQGVVQIYVAEFYEVIDQSNGMDYEEVRNHLLFEYVPYEIEFVQKHFLKKYKWKVSQGWRALNYSPKVGCCVSDDCQGGFMLFEDFLRIHYHNYLAENSAKFEQFLGLVNSLERLLEDVESKEMPAPLVS